MFAVSDLGVGKLLLLWLQSALPRRWSPSQRLTPDEALRHEWITEVGVAPTGHMTVTCSHMTMYAAVFSAWIILNLGPHALRKVGLVTMEHLARPSDVRLEFGQPNTAHLVMQSCGVSKRDVRC